MLIAAAGYIINDYYDVKIDAINRPKRVVIDRSMKRRHAILIHFSLNFVGIGLGLLITWKLSLIYAGTATVLWLYSNLLKRRPFIGNLTIALLSGTSIWLLAAFYKQNVYLIMTFGVFAMLISLMREIIKDIQDRKGDQSFGCRTLPIVWGVHKTKNLLYAISLVFMGVVAALLYQDYEYLLLYHIAIIYPLVIVFMILLARADTTKRFRMLSHLCKLILLAGVICITLF